MARPGHTSGPCRVVVAIDHLKPQCRHWPASCAR